MTEQTSEIVTYRLICLYALSHLNEKSLREACRSLIEIYSWQLEQDRLPPPTAPSVIKIHVPNAPRLVKTEFKPVVIEEP